LPTFGPMRIIHSPILFFVSSLTFTNCSTTSLINKDAKKLVHSPELENAHVGISIFDVSKNKSVYQYQANRYFIPASNTKIFTCYASMILMHDSLPGIYYTEDDTALHLLPTGDPTFLHADFSRQPVFDFLKRSNKKIYITSSNWRDDGLGFGWSWSDYNSDDMVERSPLPIYGNVIRWVQERDSSLNGDGSNNDMIIYSIPEVNWKVRFNPQSGRTFYVERKKDHNEFLIRQGRESKQLQDVPFVANGLESAVELLPDTIGRAATMEGRTEHPFKYSSSILSQPLDSVLKFMMYNSDNFFAEQLLLMAGQQLLGYMNTGKLIDTVLKKNLRLLPQQPRWVDGSGLSRYNLFTPDDFIFILDTMRRQFGMQRLKTIFPTSGTGTLSSYFKEARGYLFAKTGTLSDQVALSGYLYTRNNKLLIFSILVGNANTPASSIRHQTEAFLRNVWENY
jgi:D-alanyl-D-alanine carboxypeptidase/D-alanyl-D-alanine-endopeptidase (penicillin-binding protein 4)